MDYYHLPYYTHIGVVEKGGSQTRAAYIFHSHFQCLGYDIPMNKALDIIESSWLPHLSHGCPSASGHVPSFNQMQPNGPTASPMRELHRSICAVRPDSRTFVRYHLVNKAAAMQHFGNSENH